MKNKYIVLTFIIVLIDQITKLLNLNEIIYLIKNILYITNVHNTGAAFSILEGNTYLLIIISIIALYILNKIKLDSNNNTLNNIGYSLLYGGIIGNLIDRIIYKYVKDFIGIIIFKYYFPIFNIADIAIVLGVLILIIKNIKGDNNAISSKWR